MANWQRELNIKNTFQAAKNGTITIQELCKTIAHKLEKLTPFKDEELEYVKTDLVNDFNGLSQDPNASTDDFDMLMDNLYDWADTSLDDKFAGKKACWVRTF